MLDIELDSQTLFVSSLLGRTTFLVVFLVLLISQPKARYLLYWIGALLGSVMGMLISAHYARSEALPPLMGFIAYTVYLTSLTLAWAGLRSFHGRVVPLRLALSLAMVPGVIYYLGALADVSPRLMLPLVCVGASIPMALALGELMNRTQERLLTGYLVTLAFSGYFLSLIASGLLIILGVIPPILNTAAVPAMLADQVSGILVYFGFIAMSSERATRDFKKQASTDPLTKVANRRGGQPVLESLHELRREGSPCSVWLADIDHFKAVNDSYGHDAGDAVLTAVADRLTLSLRRGDTLVRWGGEEFLVILPNTTLAEGAASAERFRQSVEAEPFLIKEAALPITISVGGADMSHADEGYGLCIKRADEALYRAKNLGRNQVQY